MEVNAALLAILGLLWLLFAYFWYGRRIEEDVVQPDDSRPTPAQEINDGVEYVPTHPLVLYGHHFASIAGAGPIVGPILAFSLFGWVPCILWILLGSALLGAVHDYTALMASVRNKGYSVADVASVAVSRTAKGYFSAFVWLALILVIAVFDVLVAKTFASTPEIVFPTLMLIPLAMLFGWMVYRLRANLAISTIIGVILLFVFIWIGYKFPIKASYTFWVWFFLFYCLVAASLPVWVLLQPRDYLSVFILIIGLLLGYIGVFVLHPKINAPAFTSFNSAKGPLWPMLFVIIACGAISGFHSLVGSGTTSKQLRKESDGRLVGYGGMLTEGALSLLVICLMAGALFWGKAPEGLEGYVFQEALKKGAIIAFAKGFERAVAATRILSAPVAFAYGALMLNAFMLTSLDTGTRLGRYIVQETVGRKWPVFANEWVATIVTLIPAGYLALTGQWKTIWPAFGASNQLVAALSLLVVTAFFLGYKRPIAYTLVPGVFMLITTEVALIYQLFWQFIPQKKVLLSIVTVILIILGISMAVETFSKIGELRRRAAEEQQG